jgi:hypothetical protein
MWHLLGQKLALKFQTAIKWSKSASNASMKLICENRINKTHYHPASAAHMRSNKTSKSIVMPFDGMQKYGTLCSTVANNVIIIKINDCSCRLLQKNMRRL